MIKSPALLHCWCSGFAGSVQPPGKAGSKADSVSVFKSAIVVTFAVSPGVPLCRSLLKVD